MFEGRIGLTAGEFAYLEAGRGGRPLLLVHGFTGSKEDFGEELELLAARGWHAVAPELRGHGASVHLGDEDAYRLELFAQDLVEFVDAMGWGRYSLLGHSMGGMIAQVLALNDPSPIERLVLMDTHHGAVGGLDQALLDLGIAIVRTEGLRAIQDILKLGADPLANPAYERLCSERSGYREWAENKMLNCDPAMYAAAMQWMPILDDRLARLRSLDIPTLVMVGELDAAFREPSALLAETIAGARLDVLPAGGHSPQFEATAAWRASLYSFLDGA